jgi:ribosomal protein RSM22 (predicted rRNA methylase)
MELYADGVYALSGLVKSALDQEIACLPRREVSEHDTRYPTDAASMRAFLEVFFTRHLFQLQNSLIDYAASADFNGAIQSGPLRILDIGSGPAVASQALIDVINRMSSDANPGLLQRRGFLRVTHVLNDTSAICLAAGRRMVTACSQDRNQFRSAVSRPQIFTLSTAFPGNLHHIRHLASFLGGFDLVILSYVLHPLIEDGDLRSLVSGVNTLERFCTPRGRVLIIQDRFQERLVRKLASMIDVECHEQTLTQEIYPPRGSNKTCTYTYYDCLYAPRGALV